MSCLGPLHKCLRHVLYWIKISFFTHTVYLSGPFPWESALRHFSPSMKPSYCIHIIATVLGSSLLELDTWYRQGNVVQAFKSKLISYYSNCMTGTSFVLCLGKVEAANRQRVLLITECQFRAQSNQSMRGTAMWFGLTFLSQAGEKDRHLNIVSFLNLLLVIVFKRNFSNMSTV